MKTALTYLLIAAAIVCTATFAIHGFYLVRADRQTQQPTPAMSQLSNAAVVDKPVVKPKPSMLKARPVSQSETDDPNSGGQPNGDPIQEAKNLVPQLKVPETHTATVSVMPTRAFNIPNRKFRKVLIRSDYPLRVLTGKCHSDYTVEFFCEGEPADIFITDTRRQPLFMTPRANSVTITVTEF